MSNEQIKAWVTKYALTEGILVVDAEVTHYDTGTMLRWAGWNNRAHGNDWHRTPEAALARAEEMRKTKIASLKKSIAKLEAMVFTLPQG